MLELLVNDWELYQKLLDHLYKKHIKAASELHPVLMSEPSVSRSTVAHCHLFVCIVEC